MKKLRITKLLAIMALVLAFGGAMTMSAQALLIDFNIVSPSNGTGTYVTGGAFVGADIDVFNVSFQGTPLHSGESLFLTNGELIFSTGNFINIDATGNYNFNPGGSISITGGLRTAGGDVILAPTTTTLLSGSFISDPSGSKPLIDPLAGANNIFLASFIDWKNGDLLTYLGITNPFGFTGSINLSFTGALSPEGFTLQSGSGNVSNVPIPPTALLMGSGLLGLVGLGWRRRKS